MSKKLICLTMAASLAHGSLAHAKKPQSAGTSNENSVAEIELDWTSCADVEITSSKDISNIVYEVDGEHIRIEDIDGSSFSLSADSDISAVWVKSGNNKSGDGPGYGERFNNSGTNGTLEIGVTADNIHSTYINGNPLIGMYEANWLVNDIYTVDVNTCQDNVIAVHAINLGGPNAMLASVKFDGDVIAVTGEEEWLTTSTMPALDWMETGFDDTAWNPAPTCSNQGIWGTWNGNLRADGAEWVWHNTNCGVDSGEAWFRLTLPKD